MRFKEVHPVMRRIRPSCFLSPYEENETESRDGVDSESNQWGYTKSDRGWRVIWDGGKPDRADLPNIPTVHRQPKSTKRTPHIHPKHVKQGLGASASPTPPSRCFGGSAPKSVIALDRGQWRQGRVGAQNLWIPGFIFFTTTNKFPTKLYPRVLSNLIDLGRGTRGVFRATRGGTSARKRF